MNEDELFEAFVKGHISITKYQSQMMKDKLKKGVRVRAIERDNWLKEGEEGIIVCVHAGGSIGVKWDNPNPEYCWDLGGMVENGTGWFTPPFKLEIIES